MLGYLELRIDEIKKIRNLSMIYRDNVQVPPQPMPEISETHLYYTKVLLPPELILLIIFYPFLAYVALSCGPNDG